jgi:hypothetical protein
LGEPGYAKIPQQDLLLSSHEQVLRFDVAVDEVLVVRILQGGGGLLDIAQDGGEGKRHSLGMPLAYGSIGRVVHHQIGGFSFDPEVEDAHDVWVHQASDGTGLPAKGVCILTCQLRMEQLNSGLGPQVDVLPQVDLREAPPCPSKRTRR